MFKKNENKSQIGDSNKEVTKSNRTNTPHVSTDTATMSACPVKQIEKFKEILIKDKLNYTYILECNEKALQEEKRAVLKLESEISTLKVELSALEDNLKETNKMIPTHKELATKQEHKAKFWQCQRNDLIKENNMLKSKVHETHVDNISIDIKLDEMERKLTEAQDLAEEINQQKLKNARLQNVVNNAKEESLHMIGNAFQIELTERIAENRALFNQNVELKKKLNNIKTKGKQFESDVSINNTFGNISKEFH